MIRDSQNHLGFSRAKLKLVLYSELHRLGSFCHFGVSRNRPKRCNRLEIRVRQAQSAPNGSKRCYCSETRVSGLESAPDGVKRWDSGLGTTARRSPLKRAAPRVTTVYPGPPDAPGSKRRLSITVDPGTPEVPGPRRGIGPWRLGHRPEHWQSPARRDQWHQVVQGRGPLFGTYCQKVRLHIQGPITMRLRNNRL